MAMYFFKANATLTKFPFSGENVGFWDHHAMYVPHHLFWILWPIWIIFGRNISPLESTQTSYFLISYICQFGGTQTYVRWVDDMYSNGIHCCKSGSWSHCSFWVRVVLVYNSFKPWLSNLLMSPPVMWYKNPFLM